jgi:glycosyltransferase involved in cell wall biosynthesis
MTGHLLDAVVPISNFERDREQIINLLRNTIKEIHIIFVLDMDPEREAYARISIGELLLIHDLDALILSVEERNPGGARNFGLTHTSSPFVAFWDSDDEPNQIRIIEAIEENATSQYKFDIIVGQYEIAKNEDTKLISFDTGIWRMVFRREFLNGIVFPSLSMAEDQLFVSRLLLKDPILKTSRATFYRYYKKTSIQLTSTKDAFSDIPLAMKLSASLIREVNTSKKFYLMRIFYLRQALSGLKNGKIKIKIKILLSLVASINPRDLLITGLILREFTRRRLPLVSYRK